MVLRNWEEDNKRDAFNGMKQTQKINKTAVVVHKGVFGKVCRRPDIFLHGYRTYRSLGYR